jgi:hypothetical protein
MVLTLTEVIADKEQQLSKCPCGSCGARLDYDMDYPIGTSIDGEVLYPAARPVHFFCAIKKIDLDTDKMKGKQCNYQNIKTQKGE